MRLPTRPVFHNRVVMFGGNAGSGTYLNDTGDWDGKDWKQLKPLASPPARFDVTLTTVICRNRVVPFGNENDLWGWDGVNWLKRAPTTMPANRQDHDMVYDFIRARLIMFGGSKTLGDTWEYKTTARPAITGIGTRCVGSAGTPALNATGLPWFGEILPRTVKNAPTSGPSVMMIGLSKTNWLTLQLPAALLTTLLVANLTLPAQENTPNPMAAMLTPSKETKKFDIMLGNWEGKGTSKQSANGEAMPWSGVMVGKRVLGGHFIEEDLVFKLPGMDGSPMVFRGFYGFDREKKRYISIVMANDSSVAAMEIHWIDDRTMMTSITMKLEGKTMRDRWITRYTSKNTFTIRGKRTIDAGPEFGHMNAEFKRMKATPGMPKFETLAAFMPGVKPLKQLRKLAGSYRMKGSMIPAPGAPTVPISGSENIISLFSDTVLYFSVNGDGDGAGGFAYRGIHMLAWDPENDSYKMVWANNMGEIGSTYAWLRGGKLITAWSGTRMGQPNTVRTVVTLNADGSLASVTTHTAAGANPPVESFSGTYEKAK